MKQVALVLFGFLALGCASAKVSENRLGPLPSDAKVSLAGVVMDAQEEVKSEARWREAIQRGFEEEAGELGIAGGTIPVEVRVTRCSPGSQALRYWIGFGAGTGHLETTVTLPGHGDLRVTGSVGAGFWAAASIPSARRRAARPRTPSAKRAASKSAPLRTGAKRTAETPSASPRCVFLL